MGAFLNNNALPWPKDLYPKTEFRKVDLLQREQIEIIRPSVMKIKYGKSGASRQKKVFLNCRFGDKLEKNLSLAF
jgi:hypothetical protein